MSKLNNVRSTSNTLLNLRRGAASQYRWKNTRKTGHSGTVTKPKKKTKGGRKMYPSGPYNASMFGGHYSPHSYQQRPGFYGLNRVWETVDHPQLLNGEVSIDVMTYNVLSQYLLETHISLYAGCDPSHLPFDFRAPKIIAEIAMHRPTVVCMQEVDAIYFAHFANQLSQFGYTGNFYKKTEFASLEKYDGLAIFYQHSLLKLVGGEEVQYYEPGHHVLDRDNIGLISVFESLEIRRRARFCVATTHLLFNQNRGDVKLAQLAILLAKLYQQACGPGGILPVILCGDFNSLPLSPLYHFILQRSIDYDKIPPSLISGQQRYPHSPTPIRRNILPSWMDHNCTVNPKEPKPATNETAAYVAPIASMQSSDLNIQNSIKTADDNQSQPNTDENRKNANNTSIDEDSLYEQAFAQLQNPASSSAASSGESCQAPIEPWGTLHHPFKFFSCYENEHGICGGEPGVSTQHNGQARGAAVDHIFYSVGVDLERPKFFSLRQRAKYRMPTSDQIYQFGSLPNATVPSDHIPLIARFSLK